MSNPFNYPFLQRDSTMYLSTITKQDFNSAPQFLRQSTFLKHDIDGTAPRILIPKHPNQTNFSLSNYIQPIPDRSRRIHKSSNPLYIDDIEGSRPKATQFRTNRVVDPLCPKYILPSTSQIAIGNGNFFIRDTLEVKDINGKRTHIWQNRGKEIIKEPIEGSSPSKLTKDLRGQYGLKVKDINKDGIFESNRSCNPLNPLYQWRDEEDRNLNTNYGNISGSEVRKLHPDVVNKSNTFCLNVKDIQGTQANSTFSNAHFIDEGVQRLYADPRHLKSWGVQSKERNINETVDESSCAKLSVSWGETNKKLIKYQYIIELYNAKRNTFLYLSPHLKLPSNNQKTKNSFLACLKAKQFIVGTSPLTNPNTSYLHFLKFEEDNPKKSITNTKTISGRIACLASNESDNNEISLVVTKQDNQYKLKKINSHFQTDSEELLEPLLTQQNKINCISFNKQSSQVYLSEDERIQLFDFEKNTKIDEIKDVNGKITSTVVDPIREFLTYTINQKDIFVCQKNSSKEKYVIKGSQKSEDLVTGMDYNPNKQYYLMTSHHQCLKFWDIRKGNLPIKCYDNHHSLLVEAKYNHSHDELITCSYDDGSVGLLRICSVSSSPQHETEDSLIKLYDQHEDSVYRVAWSAFSPWVFGSLTFNSSTLVINLVPSVEKYRILL